MPIAPTKGGRIMGIKTTEPRRALPGKRKRSLMKASGKAIRKAMEVAAQASRKELPMPPR